MEDPQLKYKDDYLKCQTQDDFEKYFLKYAGAQDNPYLDKAKKIIFQKEKIKKENSYGLVVFLLFFGVGFFLLMFFMIAKDADNSTDRIIYRTIASVVCSPFILYPLYTLVKTVKVRSKNK